MRTNIVLDDKIVKKAMKLSKAKTKREVVNIALREFVKSHERQANIMELFGSNCIDPSYDYKTAREGQSS